MKNARWFGLVLFGSLVTIACPGSPAPQVYEDVGDLFDAVTAAQQSEDPEVRLDTDGDGLPDGIEAKLTTNPQDRDTDRDGLVDNVELFGAGELDRGARLPDLDDDGLIAPVDADDDGDGINDGELVDSDEDGIPNYLEYYGFTYDWLTDTFLAWNGDPMVVAYRTDPLHFSTDQDAYSDATEASGVGLDVSLRPPGDHPLVPAIPNIVMELVGYTVTLNEDVTYEEGKSLAKGQSWSRETTETHAFTDERNWEAGVEAGYAGGSAHVLVHANYGESYSNTQTSSTSIATGTSLLTEANWSSARSMNPTDAARLKLYVKVHNRGDAPLSNVIPTITLKIGGQNIATFEPGNAQINMLVPGGVYPSEPAVAWVIDSIDTGAGIAPIALTMRELRALEAGAPVTISVTQLLGDVMRLDVDGVWQRVGDVNEYLARCDAVGANIRVDLGDGNFVHHLVYADDSASAPRVDLGEALELLGVDDEANLSYFDVSGAPQTVSLGGYAFAVDERTLLANDWIVDATTGALVPPETLDVTDVRLGPDANVLVRAPREVAADDGPVIHFAYMDTTRNEIKACATDYQGIAAAEVVNAEADGRLLLDEDLAGAGYYSGLLSEAPFGADEEVYLVVTNQAGETAERALGRLFVQPGPRLPIIQAVSLDLVNLEVYANVVSGAPQDPASQIEWVRAYHPGLNGGAIDLEPVVNAYEDPNGYAAELPPYFASPELEVVAYVAPGVYAEHAVTSAEVVSARVAGTRWFHADIDTTGGEEDWWVPALDLDDGLYIRPHFAADDWSSLFDPKPPFDLWVRTDQSQRGWLYFNGAYTRVESGVSFESITRGDIDAYNPSSYGRLELNTSTGIRAGDILAIRTTGNRYAKARVVSISSDEDWWTDWFRWTLVLEFVTFN